VLTNPGSAANGIFASGVAGLLFEGFQADNYDDNDIFVSGAEGVTFRDMVANGPGTSVGTKYGLFPVLSNNVLIEDSLATGIRDAGIYVGQSTNIVVRNNEVHHNVAGIEIENSATPRCTATTRTTTPAAFSSSSCPDTRCSCRTAMTSTTTSCRTTTARTTAAAASAGSGRHRHQRAVERCQHRPQQPGDREQLDRLVGH
jgi:parallel beta-helix repeat protein